MKKVFAYGVTSVQGTWPVQEDGYFVHPTKSIYSIADGFGGSGSGDKAAKLVLTELRDRSLANSSSSRRVWQQVFLEDSNKKINKWNEGRVSSKKGGCSFVLAQISPERNLTLSQCGACVALVIRAGKMVPILLPQAEPAVFGGVSLPQSALGIAEEPEIEFREFLLQQGDFLLLGSSGLHWQSDNFLSEFLQQLSIRGSAGGDLGPLVAHMAGHFGAFGKALNRSLLALEIS